MDTEAGRYQVALQKFVWFYENALKYNRGFEGVRRSFALSYWRNLADVYPPARRALETRRDAALATVMSASDGRTGWDSFSDFAAINRVLGDYARTVATFVSLDQQNTALAQRVHLVARESLLRANQYALAAKYIDPATEWERDVERYRLAKKSALQGGKYSADIMNLDERMFVDQVTTMVALLVVSGRRGEGEQVAEDARREKCDREFAAALDQALSGKVPPRPFP